MSAVPADIAGIGSTLQRLRVRPDFDPLKAGLGPELYFVLSRVDGVLTVGDFYNESAGAGTHILFT